MKLIIVSLMTFLFYSLSTVAEDLGDFEKCFGISKIGENDGWKTEINPGKYRASHHFDGQAWKFVRRDSCTKRGGKLTSFVGKNPLPNIRRTSVARSSILRYEKCYGISKKGKNDGWGVEINPGKYPAAEDYNGNAWAFIKTGKCVEKGGELKPFDRAALESENTYGVN